MRIIIKIVNYHLPALVQFNINANPEIRNILNSIIHNGGNSSSHEEVPSATNHWHVPFLLQRVNTNNVYAPLVVGGVEPKCEAKPSPEHDQPAANADGGLTWAGRRTQSRRQNSFVLQNLSCCPKLARLQWLRLHSLHFGHSIECHGGRTAYSYKAA